MRLTSLFAALVTQPFASHIVSFVRSNFIFRPCSFFIYPPCALLHLSKRIKSHRNFGESILLSHTYTFGCVCVYVCVVEVKMRLHWIFLWTEYKGDAWKIVKLFVRKKESNAWGAQDLCYLINAPKQKTHPATSLILTLPTVPAPIAISSYAFTIFATLFLGVFLLSFGRNANCCTDQWCALQKGVFYYEKLWLRKTYFMVVRYLNGFECFNIQIRMWNSAVEKVLLAFNSRADRQLE